MVISHFRVGFVFFMVNTHVERMDDFSKKFIMITMKILKKDWLYPPSGNSYVLVSIESRVIQDSPIL